MWSQLYHKKLKLPHRHPEIYMKMAMIKLQLLDKNMNLFLLLPSYEESQFIPFLASDQLLIAWCQCKSFHSALFEDRFFTETQNFRLAYTSSGNVRSRKFGIACRFFATQLRMTLRVYLNNYSFCMGLPYLSKARKCCAQRPYFRHKAKSYLPLYSMNYYTILIVSSLQFHQVMKEMNDV